MVTNKYYKFLKTIENKDLMIIGKNFRYNYGKVKLHSSKNETFHHFMVKAGICYLLNKKGHAFATEFETQHGNKFDIIVASKPDFKDLSRYEIVNTNRTKPDKSKLIPISVNVLDMPIEMTVGLLKFQKWLKRFMV